MNRYQKQVSKEIKTIMKWDRFGRMTYKQARKIWQRKKRWSWCSPCEDCDNYMCEKPKMAIAYCPERR